MTRVSALIAGAAMCAGLLFHADVGAQATRTWVSGVGDDVNPCSRTAPCKTFAGAISKTATGGIINCLDPGGFGGVTITKSITIDCTGTIGSITAAGGVNGITVNAAGAAVTIRGLSIEGADSGSTGINAVAVGSLVVEDCKIIGFKAVTAMGIRFQAPGGELYVSNTVITGNGTGSTGGGLIIRPTAAGLAKASVNRSEINNNSNGILSEGMPGIAGVNLQIVDSVVSGNTNVGITSRGPSSVVMDRLTAAVNVTGVLSDGVDSQILAANSTFTGNGTGLQLLNGGNAFSYLTNRLNANGTDGSFTSTLSHR